MSDTKLTKEIIREEHGPAMSVCSPKEREFVELICQDVSAARAAKMAGWGNSDGTSTANTFARIAYRLTHNERTLAAKEEVLQKRFRNLGTKAVLVVDEVLTDKFHRDRLKAASLVLSQRIAPSTTHIEGNITHLHKIDHDGEAVAQLRSLLALGVAHDRLVSVFGDFGLERYSRMLALEDQKTKPIDADFEVIPDTAEAVNDEWLAIGEQDE